jgi:HlyD family secretion protein
VNLNIRKIVLIAIPILLLAAGGIYFLFNYKTITTPSLPKGLETEPLSRGTVISKVGSTGKARANQMTTLSWKTKGTVGKINVKNNDTVKAGDILMELDPDSYPGSVLQALQNLPAAQREMDNLDISNVKRTQAKEDLSNAEIDFKNAKDVREIKNQRNTSDTNLADAEAVYLQAKSNLESMKTMYSFFQDKPEDDLTRAQIAAQLSRAQKNYDWAVWNFQWAQSKPLPEDVKIADANLKVAEAKLSDAQRNWEKVKDNPDPDDVTAARSNLDALNAQIEQTKIVAPIDGQVTSLRLLPGDLVNDKQQALVIVDTKKMFLDVSISEVDINRVQLGQNVSFTFDAIPDKTYQGTITEISKVGTSVSDVIYFNVTCEIHQVDPLLKPGMTAAVSIDSEKVEDVLVVSNSAIITVNSKKSVYILSNNNLKVIPVEIGLVSEGQVEIKPGDLHEGDLIVTNPGIIPISASGK